MTAQEQTPRRRPTREQVGWRLVALVVFVAAGWLFVVSSADSGGLDLRASSVTDLDTVVRQERSRTDQLQQQIATLNAEVAALGRSVDDDQVERAQADAERLRGPAGFEAVRGPAVTVTLTDAPAEVRARNEVEQFIAPKELVVHQQDIQAVVNALWTGGAEAMSIQDQRVISTTGIKCVGNTVILHGLNYAPPYVITAVGDTSALLRALEDSDFVDGYKDYVAAYGLGYEVEVSEESELPPYRGAGTLRYAAPMAAGS